MEGPKRLLPFQLEESADIVLRIKNGSVYIREHTIALSDFYLRRDADDFALWKQKIRVVSGRPSPAMI